MSDPAGGRVALVVVSHSEPLARAAVDLASEMLQGDDVRVEVAAGVEDGDGLATGTDAVRIAAAIDACAGAAGVLVLLDLGSAVMSAELALDLLAETDRDRVRISPAPLVEGLVAAVVTAAGGASLDEVAAEAADGAAAKAAHLGPVEPSSSVEPVETPSARARFTVPNPHGLHARPAARLVAEVRRLDAEVALRNLTSGAGPVPAGSLSRVALLGAQQGHEVEVTASGPAAQEAVDRLVALAGRAFDETEAPAGQGAASADGPRGASPGVVVGLARRLQVAAVEVDEDPGTPGEERTRLDAALREVADEVDAQAARLRGTPEAGIFEAHRALLDDEALAGRAATLVDEGRGAADAWSTAVAELRGEWEALSDPYLRERAADVASVGDQVRRALTGAGAPTLSGPGVLLADDLTPADTAALDLDLVQGVVLAGGSPTSHAAILARARDLPLVVGAGALSRADEGTLVALDGTTGEVHLDPSEDVRRSFEERADGERAARRAAYDHAQEPATTTDGETVLVGANVGSVADAEQARAAGADESGLVRTELLFLGRSEAPDEDEQAEVYAAIAAALDRRVVLRTLDVGGDKPLPYVAAPPEDNPFLGVRGVRLALRHPDLLRTQLAAIARAAEGAEVDVMVPMVTHPREVEQVRALLPDGAGVRLGIMVEVPSVALRLAAFADLVDFVSIGTNDLTQYALAAERGNPQVADLADPLDPGVLRLVEQVVESGIPTGVCGEAAGDPDGVPLLLGLGVRELSVAPPAVPRVKALVRTLDTTACATLAGEALTLPDAAAVRRLVAR